VSESERLAGAIRERRAAVAYLRKHARMALAQGEAELNWAADAIEAGKHLEKKP
jgi:hypothetical protein